MTRRLRNKRYAIGKVALAACAFLFVSLGAAQAQTQTVVTVTSSQNPSLVGQSVSFHVTAAPVSQGAQSGFYRIFDNGVGVLGVSPNPTSPIDFNLTFSTAGNHVITVEYVGDAVFVAGTGSVTQIVNTPPPATTTTVTASPTTTFVGHVHPARGRHACRIFLRNSNWDFYRPR